MESEKKWREMNKKTILEHQPYIKVTKKDFLRPDGKELKDYYILEYPTWVNVVALTVESEIVLVDQFRPGANKIITGLPSGSVDYEIDDGTERAIRRELEEETGYVSGEFIHIGTMYPNPAHQDNLVLSYLALGVEKHQDAKTDLEEGTVPKVVSFSKYIEGVYENPTQPEQNALYAAALSLAVNFIMKSNRPELKTPRDELIKILTGQ